MESTGAKLHYLDDAYLVVKSDIAVTKRAAEKTVADVQKAQNEKLQQVDLLMPGVHAFTVCFFLSGFVFGATEQANIPIGRSNKALSCSAYCSG